MTHPPELFRRWVHVREEDEPGGVRVYRPADHPIPPARGRDGVEFRPDGTVVAYAIGPVDAPVAAAPAHGLTVAGTPYRVLSVTADLLRLGPALGGDVPGERGAGGGEGDRDRVTGDDEVAGGDRP